MTQNTLITTTESVASIEPIRLPALEPGPLVSVIIANYNYGRFLPDAVQSVLDQTYSNWELIICDDGSTDDSLTVAQELASGDPRITVLVKENGGQASAWNHAVAHSRGEILSLLDADDWFRNDKLDKVVQAFIAQPQVGLVCHRLQCTDAFGNPILDPVPHDLPSGWLAEEAFRNGGVAFDGDTTMAFRREVAARVFPLPEEIRAGDMYLGMVAAVVTVLAALPNALAFYRIHGDNDSGLAVVSRSHVESIDRWVELSIVTFSYYQRFLAEQFGYAVASQVRVSDVPVFRRYLPGLFMLSSLPPSEVHGFSLSQMLEMLPKSRETNIWRVLFAMPRPISRVLLSLWWSDAGWKRVARPIADMLGLRERRAG